MLVATLPPPPPPPPPLLGCPLLLGPPFAPPSPSDRPCIRPAVDLLPAGDAPPLVRLPQPGGTGLRPPPPPPVLLLPLGGRGGGSAACCLARPPEESFPKLRRSSPDRPPAAVLPPPPPPREEESGPAPPARERGLALGDPVGESENKNSSRFSEDCCGGRGGGGGGGGGGGDDGGGGGARFTGGPLLPLPLGGGVTLFPCRGGGEANKIAARTGEGNAMVFRRTRVQQSRRGRKKANPRREQRVALCMKKTCWREGNEGGRVLKLGGGGGRGKQHSVGCMTDGKRQRSLGLSVKMGCLLSVRLQFRRTLETSSR